MDEIIDIYQTSQKDCYIEVINQGTFKSYFTVDYSHDNSVFSFKSKTLEPGMLDKIMLCDGGTNVHIIVYVINSITNEPIVLYDKTLATISMLKLLLTGTDIIPKYTDVTSLPSPNDKAEFYTYYVSVINNANYIAKLIVQYSINGKNFSSTKDSILTNHTQIIAIPTMAQNILVSVKIRDKTTSWKSLYSNNLASPTILKLSLLGTISSPIWKNISSELSLGNLPTLSENAISVINNADFVAQFYISYNLPDTTNSITTHNFSKGETKSISIPSEATNIDLGINIMYNDNSWISIYQDFFSNSVNLKLQLTGTLSTPIVTDITNNPPPIGDSIPTIPPTIKLTKAPDKPMVILGYEVTFTLIVSHVDGPIAENVILEDLIPKEANFIPNSLIINGDIMEGNIFSDSGIELGDMNPGDSHTIMYKIKFNSVPNPNILKSDPTLIYNYINSDGLIKEMSLKGATMPLMVNQNNCCCPCVCSSEKQDNSYVDYFNYI